MKKNTTVTKAPRITATQRYEDIISLLTGNTTAHGTTPDQAVEFCKTRIAQLAKKNATENKKPTKTQVENEGYKADIVAFLATLPKDSKGLTCSEILRGVGSIFNNGFGVPKVSALCYALVEDGKIVADEVKNKTVFRIA